MNNFEQKRKEGTLFWGTALAGLGLRLGFAFAPLRFMLNFTLPDDAFYYLVIARNLATGGGVSFDRLVPTNGFHPLWGLLITPIYLAGLDGEAALRIVLVLGVILDVAAAVLFARLAAHLWPGAGTLALWFYALNPRLAMEAANGLETSLGMLALAVFLWGAVFLVESPERKQFVWLGVAAAGAFLARTDLAVIVAAVSAAALVIVVYRERRLSLDWLIYIGVGLAGVAPWFLWSRLVVGEWIQSSAVAVPLLVQDHFDLGGDLWNALQLPVINYALRHLLIFGGVSLLVLLLSVILQRLRRFSPPIRRWLGRLAAHRANQRTGVHNVNQSNWTAWLVWAAGAGALLGLGIHTLVRWYPRSWYFAPWAGLLALLAAWAISGIFHGLAPRNRFGLAILFLVFVSAQGVRTFASPIYPGQGDWLEAAAWVDSNTPPDAIVGAFNSGLIGYFSHRTVINLDGVVNWDAIHARQQFRVLDDFAQRGGRYLVDRHEMIWNSFGPFLGEQAGRLSSEANFGPVRAVHGQLVIYSLPAAPAGIQQPEE